MLVRPEAGGTVAIGQASHAWLSGQLARAWGNERFDRPAPWEEVCLAAEQHDVGMAEWDLAPRLDPERGWPQPFTEMALADHLRLWSAAPAKLIPQSRYAALLVSLHGSALYERRDLARMSAEDAAAVRGYLARQRELQDRLIALLDADRAQVARNQRLLYAWDGMSLALCLGWDGHEAEDVPSVGDAGVGVWLAPEAGARVAVDPWPFRAGELTVRCEGLRLAGRYDTEAELHAALAEAPSVLLEFTLVPAGREAR